MMSALWSKYRHCYRFSSYQHNWEDNLQSKFSSLLHLNSNFDTWNDIFVIHTCQLEGATHNTIQLPNEYVKLKMPL